MLVLAVIHETQGMKKKKSTQILYTLCSRTQSRIPCVAAFRIGYTLCSRTVSMIHPV